MADPRDVLERLYHEHALPYACASPAAIGLLEPSLRALLLSIEERLTHALTQVNANVLFGATPPPFHVDYMDAPEANAIAFQSDGWAFIIIRVQMVKQLGATSERLCDSRAIVDLLDIGQRSPEQRGKLAAAFLLIQLNFLVSHEFTHHALEHVGRGHAAGLTVRKEVHGGTGAGELGKQAEEAAADTYAVYLVLANLFDGDGRDIALAAFKFTGTHLANADEALIGLFTLAVGAFFYGLPSSAFDAANIYQRIHHPTDVRINYVMHSATSWCNQNRPALEGWITLSRYQEHLRAVVEATQGAIGRPNWDAQIVFLSSLPGKEYLRQLEDIRLSGKPFDRDS